MIPRVAFAGRLIVDVDLQKLLLVVLGNFVGFVEGPKGAHLEDRLALEKLRLAGVLLRGQSLVVGH